MTCAKLPRLHADDGLAADALRDRGIAVLAAVWDDTRVEWRRFACVVIRSTWDYHLESARYTDWLRRCEETGVNLWNPAGAVRANMHKRYLLDLIERGIEVVPTEYLKRGPGQRLDRLLARRGWDRAVVKPAISASAFGTWRTSLAMAAADQDRFDRACRDRDLLVQPVIDEILTAGEWSLVFFDGAFSHAVLKRPAPGAFRVQEELGGHAVPMRPPAPLVEQARSSLTALNTPLLYARVDGIERDGRFVLMELEINEPFLFIGTSSGAAARFAEAVVRRLGR